MVIKHLSNRKIIGLTVFCLVVTFGALGFFMVSRPSPASALSGSSFQPGHIIDDVVFTNSGSMTVQQIQDFLNSEVGSCDINGTQPSDHFNSSTDTYYTHAQWGNMHGDPPPYTCINYYVENTSTLQNNYSNDGVVPGGISAAQIIYNAAQEYQINPEVILVTLQKEQGLVTDNWPWYNEYAAAMGYDCPDSSGCNTQYNDFYKQVDGAAWQFRQYLNNPGAYNYWIGNNYIQYNPNSSCGGTVVNIQNAATAALYIYTPYQPDQAALNNLGGTGDSCSAYGNLNFWYYFNNWFGSPLAPYYAAQYQSQSAYPIIQQGSSATVEVQFTNIGNQFWKDDDSVFPGYSPTHLATSSPINVVDPFNAPSWLSGSRPTGVFSEVLDSNGQVDATSTAQHTVQPGQIAQFTFTFNVPLNASPGTYREYFQPIAEGSSDWDMGGSTYLDVGVSAASYQASYSAESSAPTLTPGGAAVPAFFKFVNSGSGTWYDTNSVPPGQAPVHLAAAWPINRPDPFSSAGWYSVNRPDIEFSKVYNSDGVTLAANQNEVQPGQVAEFDFNLQALPGTQPGTYPDYFEPILEGAPGNQWNINGMVWLPVTVN